MLGKEQRRQEVVFLNATCCLKGFVGSSLSLQSAKRLTSALVLPVASTSLTNSLTKRFNVAIMRDLRQKITTKSSCQKGQNTLGEDRNNKLGALSEEFLDEKATPEEKVEVLKQNFSRRQDELELTITEQIQTIATLLKEGQTRSASIPNEVENLDESWKSYHS